MFKLIKSIIWVAGLLAITYLVLQYFGYDINKDYFKQSKKACEKKLKECQSELIHEGLNNAKCDFKCANPRLFIKKK